MKVLSETMFSCCDSVLGEIHIVRFDIVTVISSSIVGSAAVSEGFQITVGIIIIFAKYIIQTLEVSSHD